MNLSITVFVALTVLALVVDPVAAQNAPPVLVTNAGLHVHEGYEAVISQARLLVDDPDSSPSDILFTIVSGPSTGAVHLSGVPTTTFTQMDINGGVVSYQHDGSETFGDSFVFTVSDGAGGSIPDTVFDIAVISPIRLTLQLGPAEGEILLEWIGGQPPFDVYRSSDLANLTDPANRLGETNDATWIDMPATAKRAFYQVRGQ